MLALLGEGGTLWRIVIHEGAGRLGIDAMGSSDSLRFRTIKATWTKLPDPWPGASSGNICAKNLETLSIRSTLWGFYWPPKPKISFLTKGPQSKADKVVEIPERLWREFPVSSRKDKCGSWCIKLLIIPNTELSVEITHWVVQEVLEVRDQCSHPRNQPLLHAMEAQATLIGDPCGTGYRPTTGAD